MYSFLGLEIPEPVDETNKNDKIIRDIHNSYQNNTYEKYNYVFAETQEKPLKKEILDINTFNNDNNFFLFLDNYFYNKEIISSSFSRTKPYDSLISYFDKIKNMSVSYVYRVLDSISKKIMGNSLISNNTSDIIRMQNTNEASIQNTLKYLLNISILGDQIYVSTKSGKLLYLNIKDEKSNI